MFMLTPKHIHLLPAIFFQFHVEERWGMDVQTLNVNNDKYVARR